MRKLDDPLGLTPLQRQASDLTKSMREAVTTHPGRCKCVTCTVLIPAVVLRYGASDAA